MRKLPPANYLRRRKRAKTFRKTTCPECGVFLPLSFLLEVSALEETEVKMGGKQVSCPSCKKPLWCKPDGIIEPAVVPARPPEVESGFFGWLRCAFCVLVCNIIRKKKNGTPPEST